MSAKPFKIFKIDFPNRNSIGIPVSPRHFRFSPLACPEDRLPAERATSLH
jgi:hypothetical protein